MASFTNSPEFGEFITAIRLMIFVSRNRVAELGGPSERQQQDIEGGKDMPITDRTCDQYCNFLQSRENRSVFTRPFFEAACAVFRGAQLTPELGWDEGTPLFPGAGFMLGDLTRPGSTITAGSLAFPSIDNPCAHSFADRGGGTKAFTQAASRIAARHNAVTVMPWPVAVSNNFTDGVPWPSHRTYRIGIPSNGFPRVLMDPLRGVSDLEKAYLRAAALGAAGADRTYLAWAVLLANGAAAQSETSPLEAWINVFAPDTGGETMISRWTGLLAQIHRDTGVRTTVTVDDVIRAGQRYLLPWVDEWLAANGLGFSTFTDSGDTQLKWVLDTASYRSAAWDPDDDNNASHPQLWFCDPAMIPAVPAILNDRETSNLVLDDTALTATGSQQPQFIWCPIGASERHVLLQQAGTDQWRPAVLY